MKETFTYSDSKNKIYFRCREMYDNGICRLGVGNFLNHDDNCKAISLFDTYLEKIDNFSFTIMRSFPTSDINDCLFCK